MSEKIRILAIVPYKSLHDQIVHIAESWPDMKISACIGELEDAARIAKEKEHEYDIILSRGGTAEAIGKTVGLPIITLQPTPFDLLRIMRMVENYAGKYAVVGFPDITQDVQSLFTITQRQIDVCTITEASQVEKCIQQLKAENYSMIIGDVIAVNTAKRLHLNGILITSGEESIFKALNEARRVFHEKKRLADLESFQNAITAQMDERLVVFDAEEKMLFQSQNGPDALPAAVMRRMKTKIADVLTQGPIQFDRSVDGSTYHVRGFSASIQDEPLICYLVGKQENSLSGKEGMLSYYYENEDTAEAFIDNIGKMADVYALARKFSKTSQPILILHEDGIDDHDIAYSIYRHSGQRKTSLLIIDFRNAYQKKFKLLLRAEKSPFSKNNQCIFFRNLSALNADQALEFCDYAEATQFHRRNLLIFSFSPSDIMSAPWNRYLSSINCLQLPVPSLHERREDIISLAALFLNSYNMQNGQNALTFDPEAAKLLTDYPWQQNSQQLRRVVQHASMLSDSITISASHVRAALEAEYRYIPAAADHTDLLTGTLDQIIGKVIKAVLTQENMNKTKTAERLGISRSTLWRLNSQANP